MAENLEQQLIEDLASLTHDPLAYMHYAFPWGEPGPLEQVKGLRAWQREMFGAIGEHLKDPLTRYQPFLYAVASGHGIGKSAGIGMLVNWGMSTCEDCKVVFTANTDAQLRTKTVPEITKWFNMAINR